jgi:hypothetical protein
MPGSTISYHFVPHVKNLGRPGARAPGFTMSPRFETGKESGGIVPLVGRRSWGSQMAARQERRLARLSNSRLTRFVPCPGLEPTVCGRCRAKEIVIRKCLWHQELHQIARRAQKDRHS